MMHIDAPQVAKERAIKCATLLFFSQCYSHTHRRGSFKHALQETLQQPFGAGTLCAARIALLSRGIMAAAGYEPLKISLHALLEGHLG